MANIEFSKTAKEVLQNKPLVAYIMKRLSNVTPLEEAKGVIEIPLINGKEEFTLSVIIGEANPDAIRILEEAQVKTKQKKPQVMPA